MIVFFCLCVYLSSCCIVCACSLVDWPPYSPPGFPSRKERWLSVICHVLTGDYAKDLRLLKRQCRTVHSQVAKVCWKQTRRLQITTHFCIGGTKFPTFKAKVHRRCSLQHHHKQLNDSSFYQREACTFTYDLASALLKFLATVHRAGPRRLHKSAKLRIWN